MAQPTLHDPSVRRRARALGVTLALAAPAVVWGLWRVFVDTWAGQRVEQVAFWGADRVQGRLWGTAERVLDVVSFGFVVAAIVTAVLVAVVRRRWLDAAQAAVLVAGANLTTQVVKAALPREDLGVWHTYGNTLPSGHTTVAASVGAALVLVVPRRARPLVAVLAAVYTAATGVSTLVEQWHRPSDVVAAVAVVVGWAALVTLLTHPRPRRPRPTPSTPPTPTAPTAPTARPERTELPRASTGANGAPRTADWSEGSISHGVSWTLRSSDGRGGGLWVTGDRGAWAWWGMGVLGAVSALVAGLALVQTWATRATLASPGDQLLAFTGGAAAAVAASAVLGLVVPVLRRAT
jgi:membrane-associated phospholipid phosphatase